MSVLDPGYVGLVVADTRRATEWERGLRAEGYDVVRVETRGPDADKGAWQIAVRADQADVARRFVTSVVQGERSLPSHVVLSRTAWVSLIAIVAIVAGLGGWCRAGW